MIDIAFCFDENMVLSACVAIASLLDSPKNEQVHYNIYCICTEQALVYNEQIESIVRKRDCESRVTFYQENDEFSDAYEVRGITRSTYLRLSLHRILSDKEKVIYADTDVLFMDELSGLWNVDMADDKIAGVKGANNFKDTWEECLKLGNSEELSGLRGKYINAGILLMNLRAIRDWNPDSIWKKMAKKNYHYQDQDILNITCKGEIKYLDMRYNVQAHLTDKELMRYAKEGIYSKEQCMEAVHHPAIIHYTGPKPWNNRGVNKGKIWWNYVRTQEDLRVLFDESKVPNRKTTGLMGKINRHLPF